MSPRHSPPSGQRWVEAAGYHVRIGISQPGFIHATIRRDEPRDLINALRLHHHVLPLGPLVWAATGKDPGFSPRSLLELLKRRGGIQADELRRLGLDGHVDPKALKAAWREALANAEDFLTTRPHDEAGCLYWLPETRHFVDPRLHPASNVVPQFGRPGGVLPRIITPD